MSLEARILHAQNILGAARQAGATRLAVMVSGGRDSSCLAEMVHRAEIPATYIHRYLIPDLEVNEIPLRAMEQRLGMKIVRVATPMRQQMLDGDMLCINKVWDADIKIKPFPASFDRFIHAIAKTEWLTTGIRSADSPMRMLTLTKHPNPNIKLKKVYPLASWRKQDVKDFIAREKIVVSPSYPLMNRSFELLNIKHVYPLKAAMPGDYKKICADFPLMDALCWVYEKRIKKFGSANLPEC